MAHSPSSAHPSGSSLPFSTPVQGGFRANIYRSFLRGMVKLFILRQAEQGVLYGGSFSKALQGLGYDISPGSLYPLLHTLAKEKLLRCRSRMVGGRVRKYYELTDQGRACLTEVREDLSRLIEEVLLIEKPSRTIR